MARLDWLLARPIAHRGLHDAKTSVIENTPPAFSAAIAHGYGIECDVQQSADGEAMVHHDDTLDRLTEGKGHLTDLSAAALKAVAFKNCTDSMLTLGELCDLVDGRVTLLVEIKRQTKHRNESLVRRVADVLCSYSGPAAVMSFDPEIITTIRNVAPRLACGLVAKGWDRSFIKSASSQMAYLLQVARTRPRFIACAASSMPAISPLATRYILGSPLLAWTICDEAEAARSRGWADQIIFEGWLP